MNYAEMSDFEINKSVADSIGYNGRTKKCSFSDTSVIISDGMGGFSRDYCNSWSDAGAIIQENGITLIKTRKGDWVAITEFISSEDKRYSTTSITPTRAAMIAFLMMRDGEGKSESH